MIISISVSVFVSPQAGEGPLFSDSRLLAKPVTASTGVAATNARLAAPVGLAVAWVPLKAERWRSQFNACRHATSVLSSCSLGKPPRGLLSF
jgi:hypothetical protein